MQCGAIQLVALFNLAVLQVVLPAQRPNLVLEPAAISRTLDYGAAPVKVDLIVESDAVSAHNVSVSLVLGSSDRRLSYSTPSSVRNGSLPNNETFQSFSDHVRNPAPRHQHRSPNHILRGLRSTPRRLLFGWGSSVLSAGHARRLRVVSRVAAAEDAEVKILQSVGVGILFGGNHQTMRRLRAALPGVISFVERDQVLRRQSSSASFSDPLLSEQWALRAVRHQEAIEQVASRLSMRTSDIVVAVIDSGVHADHPDLAGQLWENPGEIPGNFIDDDGNGYVDDINGWDFAGKSADLRDADWHGTHCAGIIAAAADNQKGIVGMAAPARARVMVLKFTSSEGGLLSDAIQALEYAMQNGAVISSNSFGGPTRSEAYEKALENAAEQGHIVVAAAGNEAQNVESFLQFPCAYKTSSIICVAASTQEDRLAAFSNYGRSRVHIAAPGADIVSTVSEGKYAVSSGTSMAAPHVAAALAVLQAAFPHLSLPHLRMLLLESARYVPSMSRWVGARGVLDLESAVRTAFSVAWVRVLQSPLQLGGASRSELLRLELGVAATTPPLPEGRHTSSLKLQLWRERDAKDQIIPVSDIDLPLELFIQGTPELRFAQASLDFSHVIANSSAARKELLVSNVGNGTADASVTIQGGKGAFSILAPTEGQLLHLPPGISTPIIVACVPEHVGSLEATLVLRYSLRHGEATMSVAVTAIGTTPPELHTNRWSGLRLLHPVIPAVDLASAPAQWHRLLLVQDAPLIADVRLPPAGQQQACRELQDGHQLDGHIVLVDRGSCTFWAKARNCENAGAIGMLVANSDYGDPVVMAMPTDVAEEDVPTIPAFMTSRREGENMRNLLMQSVNLKVEMRLQPIVVKPMAATPGATGSDPDGWKSIQVELRNTGGAPFTYTVASRADIFERTGAYEVQIGQHVDGASTRGGWHALGVGTEVQYFAGQDDASIFVEFPAAVPFAGSLVSSGWLSLNGYLVLDPDYVPLGSYIPGWIGPEYAPRATIAPYWDDLFCSTFCKVRVGTVMASTVSTSKDWAFVAQFENVHVLSGGHSESPTVSFQLTLHHDGTIEMAYHKWPSAVLRQRLVVGVEGFDVDGFALHDYRDRTILPWEQSEPFSVRMLPWLIPTSGTQMMGKLTPGRHVSLAFRLHLGLGDRQGWVTISTEDAYNSYKVSRNIRIVIQTAVRFSLHMPIDRGICGESVIIFVNAESVDGKIAKSEERNVLLILEMGDGGLDERVVPITGGKGNVTLRSEKAGEWRLSLEDRFNTGLDTSATTRLQWVSGPARYANIDVHAVQVAGMPFHITIVFLDSFGNIAVPTDETLGAAASATIRWRSSRGFSGAAVLSLATGNYAVQLEFEVPQSIEFWPEPAGESAEIAWGSTVHVSIVANDYEFVPGTWKACSQLCGVGQRHREVICRRIGRNETDPNGTIAKIENVTDHYCRGLVRPQEYEECSGTCIRGACNKTSGRSCVCPPGFEGLRCEVFAGCPSGFQAKWESEELPDRCEGVQCQAMQTIENVNMQVTNGGRFPSQLTFSCASGYTLVGADTATCQADGSWLFHGGDGSNWCQGPDVRNASCKLGDECTLDVTGRGLEPQNHLVLVRNARDCPVSGVPEEHLIVAATEVSNAMQKFSWLAVTKPSDDNLMTGTYSMCWAASAAAAAKWLYASIGLLVIEGPLPANLVCMLGAPCMLEVRGIALNPTTQVFWISAGELCSVDGDRATQPFDGWHADGPRISAVGSGSEVVLVDWGVALGGDVNAHGTLCWQGDDEHAEVSLGQFAMQGPARHDAYLCTLGTLCAFTLEGLGFSLQDMTALYTDDACTAPQAYEYQNASALLRGGGAARFEFGVLSSLPRTERTGQLSVFALCWLAGNEPGARPVVVSNLEVYGPAAELTDAVCTLGVNCTVRFVGRGFTAADLVQVRLPVKTAGALQCGPFDGSQPLEFKTNHGLDADEGFSMESGAAFFNLGVVSLGSIGNYNMCWGSSGSHTADVPGGSFTLHGPSSSLYSCELGEPCGVSISGLGLSAENWIQLQLQGACGETLVTEPNVQSDLQGLFPAKDLRDDRTAFFDLGVPRTGYLNRPQKICWQYATGADFVDAGTLTLSASGSYLNHAASNGLLVQYWISGYCDVFAPTLNLGRQRHFDAVLAALASLQGVSAEDIQLSVINQRLLDDSNFGNVQQAHLYFVTTAYDDAAARYIMARLKDAASSDFSSVRHDFVARLTALVPDAEVVGAVFEEPWLDTGVFKVESKDVIENPWGLPWWPSTRFEMFLTGFFTVGLALMLFTCMTCCMTKWWRKRLSARSGLVSAASPAPVSAVAPDSSTSNGTMYGRPAPAGHARVGAIPDILPGAVTDAERHEALGMMLTMGFQHARATEALQRYNWQVEPAIQHILAINERFVGRHGYDGS